MSKLRLPNVTTFGPELLQQAFDALTQWTSTGQFPVSATPPSNPAAGDFWVYQGAGFCWMLVYYPAVDPTYPWFFVGGPRYEIATTSVEQTTAGGFIPATAPRLTIPRPGIYNVGFGSEMAATPNANTAVGWSISLYKNVGAGFVAAGGAATIYYYFQAGNNNGVTWASSPEASDKYTFSVSGTILALYGAPINWDFVSNSRYIWVQPLNVS